MTLGEKLTQARKTAGLTQADAAAKLDVSRQAVSRWESGQSKPSTEKLLALGELYGVSIDRLLNLENAKQPVLDAASSMSKTAPEEPVLPEKRRTQAWPKYAAAALCGALLMLAVLLVLKKAAPPEEAHSEPTTDVKYDNISGEPIGGRFEITWVD